MTRSGDWSVDPDADWERVRRAFEDADDDLLRDLERAIDQQMHLAAWDAAAQVRSIPTTGHWSEGLRSRIARSIRVVSQRLAVFSEGGAYARVEVDLNDVDDIIMARALDKQGGWDHPVFGGSHEVHQTGRPWFYSTLRAHAPLVALAVRKVLDDTARRIESAGY